MRSEWTIVLALLGAAPACATAAESAPAVRATKDTPTRVEYYYRVRWGAMDEYKALYAKNHQPVLEEMKRLGFITHVETVTPVLHMVGPARWDLRVDIDYPSLEDAAGEATGYETKQAEVIKRLYPDQAKYWAEEAKRFSLLDEHWDVIVSRK